MPKFTIQENIPLAPHTTLHVGGPARYFAVARSLDDLREALAFARERQLPVFALGGGSNIVVSDQGFPGLVIKNELGGFEIRTEGSDRVSVVVGAGEVWDDVVELAVGAGFAGIEFLSGVPGTVGGAAVQNIGAYGQTVAETIREVRAVHVATANEVVFRGEECGFRYRDSIFKTKKAGEFILTSVTFGLVPGGAPDISAYHDVQKFFAGLPDPDLKQVREAILEIRAKKGMVILPDADSYKSVGSFFKNPVITPAQYEKVKEEVLREKGNPGCADPWSWEGEGGGMKVAAACLLERAGFAKNYAEGDVAISPRHSLALVNLEAARAEEIVAFARKIQDTVYEKFGVLLESEAQIVGFSEYPLRK